MADIAYATGNLIVTNGAGFQTTATAVAESVAGGIDTITYQLANAPTADGTYSVYVSGYNVAADGLASTAKITVTGSFPPAAPTGSFPSTGNSVTFDGTKSVTAAKGDLLVLTLDPQTFAGGAEQNGNVVLSATNGTSATITNAFLTSDGIPNTFVPQGDFLVGREGFSITSTKANSILIGLPGSEQIRDIVDPSLAAGSHFISGGVGRVDSTDGADTISFGGKGLWSVFANAGADIVTQDGAGTSGFDSASVVNVYGQEGNDSITLTNAANSKASIFVSGGTGLDTISVVNAGGATTIYGGDDSTDGADIIAFNAAGTAGAANVGSGGTVNIFGNGGDDKIYIGYDTAGVAANGVGLDSTSTATVFGGYGNDTIAIRGIKAAITVIGGEGSDNIAVQNTGTTFITGGNPSGGDQSLDGADTISFQGSGNLAIYGNLGDDRIDFLLNDSANASTINIYGGKGSDTITETVLANIGNQVGAKAASVFIAGGEDGDTIIARGNGGAVTIYGGISSSDSADGADSINYVGGTGTANIFANGGNDTVSIGMLGVDSTNTVTVYGGGGADSITIAGQAVTSQAITVLGNEGADTFAITKGAGQTITVADFTVGGGDKLALTGLGGAPGGLAVTGGSYQALQDALNAAANTANATTANQAKAAAVVFAGSTYVVIDNTANTAGFQATDQAIKLTGVTDLIGLVGVTTVAA